MNAPERHAFTVGDDETGKEFNTVKLGAFKANAYLLKMKSMLGALFSKGMDSQAASLINIIDEKTMKEIIFPLLTDTQTTCTTDQVKMVDANAMDKVFNADTLGDFYALVWEVIKYNFAPFISKLAMSLFGLDLERAAELIKVKLKEAGGKLLSDQTSTPNTGSGNQSLPEK